jgi:hypothetical protein
MKKPWPKNRDESADAVNAFSAALTKGGRDPAFRAALVKSPEDARSAVSDEGQIEIPGDVVVIFHEPDNCQNIFPFYLPTPEEPLLPYYDYFQGCRPKFQLHALAPAVFLQRLKMRHEMRIAALAEGALEAEPTKPWTEANIADAFTAVLARSQSDSGFRKSLTASLSSAKQAVATEGGIEIPPEVVILFHEDESNERYHMFRLPPLNENAPANYHYRAQFEGFYFVW